MRGGGRDMSSYIQRWSTSNVSGGGQAASGYKVLKTHRIRHTIITSMQTSRDGQCVCAGDYEGQIYLLDANFNSLARFKKQHSSVVTDLAFYHDSPLAFNSNKLILSLSIDRTLQCYTYLNTTLNKKPLSAATAGLAKMSSQLSSVARSLPNKLNLNSMNTFRLFLILVAFFLLFCYFFTHFEE